MKLTAEKRDIFGKALAKARKAGKLPVVVYGRKDESVSYFVDAAEFRRVLREAGESVVITFQADDGDKDVLIKEVDFDPVKGSPIHADFYAIEKGKPVTVNVPLIFEGVAPAVKELSGNLVKVLHELEIEALPKDLPHEITVDVSTLINFESQILVKDLPIPAGVTVLTEAEDVVASVSHAGEEVVEEEAPVDLSEIEVEQKGKKEEEGEAGEASQE